MKQKLNKISSTPIGLSRLIRTLGEGLWLSRCSTVKPLVAERWFEIAATTRRIVSQLVGNVLFRLLENLDQSFRFALLHRVCVCEEGVRCSLNAD